MKEKMKGGWMKVKAQPSSKQIKSIRSADEENRLLSYGSLTSCNLYPVNCGIKITTTQSVKKINQMAL